MFKVQQVKATFYKGLVVLRKGFRVGSFVSILCVCARPIRQVLFTERIRMTLPRIAGFVAVLPASVV